MAAVLLNCGLFKLFFDLEDAYSTWWAPVLLLDIVIHFLLLAQAVLDWFSWDGLMNHWQKELLFNEEFARNAEVDESQLKANI